MIAEVLTDISEAEWRAFLAETPGANVFQSPDLMRVYRKAQGYRSHVVAVESGGRVRALMASAIVSYTPGRLSSLSARAVVTGGPLGDVSHFPALLAAHDREASKAALLTQVRNLTTPPDPRPFETAGYSWEDHLNFLIDLDKGEEALLTGMSKARRKGIVQAERVSLKLRELRLVDLPVAYGLLEATYSRAEVPLAHRSLFYHAVSELAPEHLIALGAEKDGELRAVRFVLQWGATLYDWYAGSALGEHLHADEWLVWQALHEGMARGCTRFDFGGAGRPDEPYGPREFKRRFGGATVNPGRFQKIYKPVALKVAKAAMRLGRRIDWAFG